LGADPIAVKAARRLRQRVAGSIPIERLVLFGSRGRGEGGPHSDVDLLVVSPAFEGLSAGKRAAPLYRAWDADLPVDFLCYSPAEFERLRERVSLVRVALQEGVELAA
jgi:hypothetical protein